MNEICNQYRVQMHVENRIREELVTKKDVCPKRLAGG